MRLLSSVNLALTLAVLITPAHAACTGEIEEAAVDAEIEPYGPATSRTAFSLELHASCQWQLSILTETQGPAVLGEALSFDVLAPGGDSALRGRDAITSYAIGGEPSKRQLRLDLVIQTNAPPRAGLYTASLPVELRDKATGELLDRGLLRLRIQVPQHLGISLAGADIARSVPFPDHSVLHKIVDFGELETGESRDLFVLLRVNVPHRLTLRSRNRGALRHDDLGQEVQVPYLMRLDEREMNLRGDANSHQFPPSDIAGARVRMTITIGDVSHAIAGAYSDTIEITVESIL